MDRLELYRGGPNSVSSTSNFIKFRNIQLIKNLTSCASVPPPPVLVTIPACPAEMFLAQFWSNPSFLGHPDYALCAPYPITQDFVANPVGNGIPTTSFSASWEGYFTFEPALYSVVGLGDDFLSASVDNVVLFSNFNGTCCRTQRAQLDLRNLPPQANLTKFVQVKHMQGSTTGAVAMFDWRKIIEVKPYTYTIIPNATLPAPCESFCHHLSFSPHSLAFFFNCCFKTPFSP